MTAHASRTQPVPIGDESTWGLPATLREAGHHADLSPSVIETVRASRTFMQESSAGNAWWPE